MNATIEQTAVMSATTDPRGSWYRGGETRASVISIDGVRFSSPAPANAGEAETFNRLAREICAAANK